MIAVSIARMGVGLLFVLAALPKLDTTNRREFLDVVMGYEILPAEFAASFSVWLPRLEVVTGISLLFGVFIPVMDCIGCLLLVMFIVAVSISLARGMSNRCGCLSPRAQLETVQWRITVRNLLLLTVLVCDYAMSNSFGADRLLGLNMDIEMSPLILKFLICLSLVTSLGVVCTRIWVIYKRNLAKGDLASARPTSD